MKELKTRKGHLWGTEYDVTPYLLDAVHGDGKQLMCFEFDIDRPFYYVVKVDSTVDLNNHHKVRVELLEWILNAINEESEEFLTEEQLDEIEEIGSLSGERPWPVPPCPVEFSGYSWGGYTGSLELNEQIKNGELQK